MAAELPIVDALASQVSDLKRRGLISVCVAANWLAHRVTPLKKQVHPGWEYIGLQDLSRESIENIRFSKLVKLLEEMFQNTSSWPLVEEVRSYHLGMERPDKATLLGFTYFLLVTHPMYLYFYDPLQLINFNSLNMQVCHFISCHVIFPH
jgi:hypothetical protein